MEPPDWPLRKTSQWPIRRQETHISQSGGRKPQFAQLSRLGAANPPCISAPLDAARLKVPARRQGSLILVKGADPVDGRNLCADGLLQRRFSGQPSGENMRRFPNSRCAWPAKAPVNSACFASETRTARGMWWSRHGRRISRHRAEKTFAERMSPLPHTVLQQGPGVFEERSLSLQRRGRDAIFPAFPCIKSGFSKVAWMLIVD